MTTDSIWCSLPAFSSLLWLNEVGSEGLVIVCFCQLEDARNWNCSTFALGWVSTAQVFPYRAEISSLKHNRRRGVYNRARIIS